MAAAAQRPELLTIVGPTATGKSELALKIAKEFNGEIIAADSRTIYKDLNVGTAKPSRAEQQAIKHHGLDLIVPGKNFSAARFKKYAEAAILEVQSRDKLPILVGGTGLYVDSVLFDFSFINRKLPLHHRLFVPWWSVEKLQKMIQQRDWPVPENRQNRRYLIAALRRAGQTGTKSDQARPGTLIIGLLPSDSQIKANIAERADKNFGGLIKETRHLTAKYGRRNLKNGGIAYKIAVQYLNGEINEAQAKAKILAAEWQYARRQKTWFKRNKNIKWFADPKAAFDYLQKVLNT